MNIAYRNKLYGDASTLIQLFSGNATNINPPDRLHKITLSFAMNRDSNFPYADMLNTAPMQYSFPHGSNFVGRHYAGDVVRCSRCRWEGCDVKINSCGCSYHVVSPENIHRPLPSAFTQWFHISFDLVTTNLMEKKKRWLRWNSLLSTFKGWDDDGQTIASFHCLHYLLVFIFVHYLDCVFIEFYS